MKGTGYDFDHHCFFKDENFGIVWLLLGVEKQLTYNTRRQKDKRTRETVKTIALWSGVLL